MKLRLRFSAEARTDLQSIREYLKQEAGPRAAARYLKDLSGRLARLRGAPKTGVAMPELGAEVRFAPCRSHLIYYELEDRTVVILRILHAAQDRPTILRRRK